MYDQRGGAEVFPQLRAHFQRDLVETVTHPACEVYRRRRALLWELIIVSKSRIPRGMGPQAPQGMVEKWQ